MTLEFAIRESEPNDLVSLEALYPEVFPEEDLLPLVRKLHAKESQAFAFVAVADGALLGHVVFTICGLAGSDEKLALLGPLAVALTRQRQGLGKALVHAGLKRLEESGTRRVCVLGDPGYYGRFGFAADYRVAPPYPLPKEWREAWQSLDLQGGASSLTGELLVPESWRQPALWGP